MRKIGLEMRCAREAWYHAIAFYLVRNTEEGTREIATDITFAPLSDRMIVDPSFKLHEDDAQALMDELWMCGLRPTEGRQSQGVTDAQASHLSDMRAIAFAKLEIERP